MILKTGILQNIYFKKKMKKIKKNRTGFKTIDPLPNKEKIRKILQR